MVIRISIVAATVILCTASIFAQTPLGTDFTYQGRLSASGLPDIAAADFQFALFDAATAGSQVGATLSRDNVGVIDGLFTVTLDFGVTVFNGNARWIEVTVRSPAGAGSFTTLSPRQPISAAPYALKTRGIDGHSLDAADGSPTDAVFVDNVGRVGIGTTTPLAALNVKAEATPPGGTLALEGVDHSYLTFFPDGALSGRKGYVGFALPGSSDITIANEASNGRIRLADESGVHFPAAGPENLGIIRGSIASDGDILAGQGFTCERLQEGRYVVTFNSPFSGDVTATANVTTVFGTNVKFVEVIHFGNAQVGFLVIQRSDGAEVDGPVQFIVVGPR